MKFVTGATQVTVNDGGVGDLNPADGAITYLGSIGDWSLNVATGLGSDILGLATMDLGSSNTAFIGSSSPLTVWLTQLGNTLPVSGFLLDFGGTSMNVASISYSAYADDADTPFGTSQSIGTVGPFGASNFSGSASGLVSVSGTYSLTQALTIQAAGTRQTSMYSGDAQLTPIQAVPEPASLVLFGSGLFGLAGSIRRRHRSQR